MFTGRRPRAFQFSAVLTPAILGQARQVRKMQLPFEQCVLYSWPQKGTRSTPVSRNRSCFLCLFAALLLWLSLFVD
jgi:hypothetical protein